MKYVSTRATAPALAFDDVLLTGLARDGGLYVPEHWPELSADDLVALRGKSYADVAYAVMQPFIAGTIPDAEFARMVEEAYAGFDHAAVTPLKQLDANQWLLELFHGPTLAFKDVAMQLLVRLMDWVLEKRDRTVTIVGATSGDTGGAAIEAFRHSKRAKLFILHPHNRVSPVQRAQMTTVVSDAVHNIALEGTFDDCQAQVKAMFNAHNFRDELGLAGVNSINWARIMAQISYYIFAGVALGAPDRQVSFCVPTGNFGDIFAGYGAKRMGLPIDRLVIATNQNDILDRALKTGRYEVTGVAATTSPSMDIQISSNFERLLFEACGRDGAAIGRLMAGLKQSGSFTIPEAALDRIRQDFDSEKTDEAHVMQTIANTLAASGELLDPHTAVGYAVASTQASTRARSDVPMITLATAHPAKFPDAVEKASGIRPELPARLCDLLQRDELFSVVANDFETLQAFVRDRI